MPADRRDLLRDAVIEVLAGSGSRGLTHRAVDEAARVPSGTAKNYFPSREALLRAVAERCVELYRAAGERLAARRPPRDRAQLAAFLAGLLHDAAGSGRDRLLAYQELQAESSRRPWLSAVLDPVAAADFPAFEQAQRAAGLPVTAERAAVVTLALHAALPHLLSAGPATLAASGLDDPERFVRALLDTVYPHRP